MKMLNDLIKGTTVIILGDYLRIFFRDCFHITELSEVCKQLRISDDVKQKIIKEWKHNNKYCKDEENLNYWFTRSDVSIPLLLLVARHNDQAILDRLLTLNNDTLTAEVMKHNRPKDYFLLNSGNDYLDLLVVRNGTDEHLNILILSEDYRVRRAVARHKRPQDLDILVNDPDCYVRKEVAKIGRPQDLDILVKDPNATVRKEVLLHKRMKDLEILFGDKSQHISAAKREYKTLKAFSAVQTILDNVADHNGTKHRKISFEF